MELFKKINAIMRSLIEKLPEAVMDHLVEILISAVCILFMHILRVVAGKLSGSLGSSFMSMVEVVKGQFVGLLVSAKSQVSLVLHLEDEIEYLRKQLPDLKAVILRAEVKPETEEMRRVFKDFVEDAEDILDEFDANIAPRLRLNEVADLPPTNFKPFLKVRGYLPSSSGLGSLLFHVRIAIKIEGLLGGLEKRKSGLDRRQLVASAMESLDVVREPSEEPITDVSPLRDLCFVGREDKKEEVTKELLSGSVSKPSVVLITGKSGIGKTTLVQYILRQSNVVKFFEFISWTRVSDELDPKVVVGNILGRTIDDMLEISSKLEGKRFLIVLDDLRSGELSHWNTLRDLLNKGGEGSKVVITSSDKEIHQELGDISLKSYELGILSDVECLKIFESYAFPAKVPPGSSEYDRRRLREIGGQIIQKIKGDPFVAKVLGSSLRNEDHDDIWNNVPTRVDNEYINSVLRWSYQRLPSHLKQCIAFCMLLPKAHILRKEHVVWMWIACGYVQPKGNAKLECLGENYFDYLVKASLIQHAPDYEGKWQYTIHDLVHDLATNVFDAGCFLLNGIVALGHQRFLMKHPYIKKPRVLVQCNSISANISEYQLQYARVLAFNSVQSIAEINFASMIHLRYLDLSEVQNYTPPESICSIYNMQTLILNDTVENFPLDMWKLPNLRHLVGGPYIRMVGIGNSASLQTISNFNVFMGKDIEELAHLNELRKLKINHLNCVHSRQYALKAQLSKKEYIEELVLDWEHLTLRSDERQYSILEDLCPHGDLSVLEINGYMGDRPPSWMGSKHLSNLVRLSLSDLHHMKDLPPLGHHSNLQFLSIDNLRNVRCIGTEFYGNEEDKFHALKELHLKNMPELEEWKGVCYDRAAFDKWFAKAELWEVSNCRELTKMPHIPQNLKRLLISSTGLMVLPESYSCDLKLEELKIHSCHSLCPDKWFQKYEITHLSSLELWKIDKCAELVIKYDPDRLRLLYIRDLAALKSITLSQFGCRLSDGRFNDEQPSTILLECLDALNRMTIENCRDGKITAGRLKLTSVLCNRISLLQGNGSKFEPFRKSTVLSGDFV